MRWFSVMSQRRATQHRRRGATAVEFALTFPLLLLLTMGIFEFGRAIWIMHSMQEALNITGRYAIYNPNASNDQLTTYFGQNITVVPANTVTLNYVSSTTGTVPFTAITATYNFTPVTNIAPFIAFTLTSSTRVPRI